MSSEHSSQHPNGISSAPAELQSTPRRHFPWSGRNLVVCLDGTNDSFSARNSNVVKLFALSDSIYTTGHERGTTTEHRRSSDGDGAAQQQLLYYDSGVGTSASELAGVADTGPLTKIKQTISTVTQLMFAWDFGKHVVAAYKWLMDYYKDGDRIYICGFSRGAYSARALAGFIDKCGLLPAGNESQLAFSWQSYVSRDDGSHAEEWKKAFSRSRYIDVHFVGVWDTVSSIGIINLPDLPFSAGSGTVHYFRHALALDEHRAKFIPDFYHPDASDTQYHDVQREFAGEDHAGPAKVKEVWFNGVHSDDGGGYELNNASAAASNIPLRWMIREAVECGLLIDPEALCESPAYKYIQDDELKRLIPAQFRIEGNEDNKSFSAGSSAGLPDIDWRAIVRRAADLDSALPPSPSDPLYPDLAAPLHESLKGLWVLVEYLPLAEYKYLPGSSRRAITWSIHRFRPRQMIAGQQVHRSVYRRLCHMQAQSAEGAVAWPYARLPAGLTWQEAVAKPADDPLWAL